ncbi:MAG: hypothetical protein CMH63_02485 [Nanoarchaeota archaeon]|nr:hypothetical protein [Nanoarchaeota archaeon]
MKKNGVESLDSAELLAVVLWYGTPGESALELSNRLLRDYNLNHLDELSVVELKKECKGNEVKALKILSLIELSKRYNKLIKGGYNSKPITCAKDVYDMMIGRVSFEIKRF